MNNPLTLVDPSGFLAGSPGPITQFLEQTEENLKATGVEAPPLMPIIALGLAVTWTTEKVVVAADEGAEAWKAHQEAKRSDQRVADTEKRRQQPNPQQPGAPQRPAPHETRLDPNTVQNSGGDQVNPNQSPAQETKPDAPKQEPKKDDGKDSSGQKDQKDAASKKAEGDLKPLDKRAVNAADMHAFKEEYVGKENVAKFDAKVTPEGNVVLVSKDGKTKVETNTTAQNLPKEYPKEKDKDKDKDRK
jgi:hypothetical protein